MSHFKSFAIVIFVSLQLFSFSGVEGTVSLQNVADFLHLSKPTTPKPATTTSATSGALDWNTYILLLTQLYEKLNLPIPTRPPTTTSTPRPDGCQPEKVRIILVHGSEEKSSESCEDSDEVDIVVPYTKQGRQHHIKH